MARVVYEKGKYVKNDYELTRNILISNGRPPIETDHRIKVVFGDDADLNHTNQIIIIFEYLGDIPAEVVFNPANGEIIEF